MVQVPAETRIAVVPETVQTPVVVDVKLTARPEDAVALRLVDPVESDVAGIVAKLMDWVSRLTYEVCETDVAAA